MIFVSFRKILYLCQSPHKAFFNLKTTIIMKNINNNIQLLLLFTSLLFSTQIIAQRSNEELVDNIISTVSLNYIENSTDNFIVVLDEVEIILKNSKKSIKKEQNTNKKIIGNTISKLGNNFCDLFSQYNQSNGVTYPFAINIIEIFEGDSRFPEICILANNNIIYKFRSLPKDAYLYAAVQESNKRLKEYLLSSKQLYAVE